MFGETNTSFLNGSTALSFIAYGLFSAFVSGPELLHREAIKVQWPQQCMQLVREELYEQQPQPDYVPSIDLGGLMDGVFGRGASSAYGGVINPMQKMIDLSNQHARQLEQLNEQRLQRKAEAAGSRCNCAVTMLSEHRVSLGLYAASGRLVTPNIFKDLSGSLRNTLRVPRCAQAGS